MNSHTPITMEQLEEAVTQLSDEDTAAGQCVYRASVGSHQRSVARDSAGPVPEVPLNDVYLKRDHAHAPWRYEGELEVLDGELVGPGHEEAGDRAEELERALAASRLLCRKVLVRGVRRCGKSRIISVSLDLTVP